MWTDQYTRRMATLPRTERGRRTRERLVRAAAELFRAQGVRATGVDDVLERAECGKSQLYHYFDGKADLVAAVLDHQLDCLLDGQREHLAELTTWAGIERWLAALPGVFAGPTGVAACPLGALAAELAGTDEDVRHALVAAFDRWSTPLAEGLAALRDRGELAADADPARLARATIGALQGGLLMARTYEDPRALSDALDGAYAGLRAFAR
ncbi:Transcriptional regulator AcuR [Actinokineospora sp. UTMC 2448]|nr:Transcriptional regulator AcuR [Actinokineospora sp. UTMC 2448]